MAKRVKRDTPTYPEIDYTVPIDKVKYMAEVDDSDCFGIMFSTDDRLCHLCHDMEICHILQRERQNKIVKQLEKDRGGFLDSMKFNQINREKLFMWLEREPRTFEQMVDKIAEKAECPDHTTTIYWCRSFVKEHPRLGIKGGIVIVKP